MRLILFFFVLLPILVNVHAVWSQEIDGDTLAPPPLRLTLDHWADQTWFKIADRDGNILGRHDGVLQRFFTDQDSEYRNDVRTSGFPLITDYQWALQDSGLRFATGSIDKPHLLTQVHVKKSIRLGKNWLLRFQYAQED